MNPHTLHERATVGDIETFDSPHALLEALWEGRWDGGLMILVGRERIWEAFVTDDDDPVMRAIVEPDADGGYQERTSRISSSLIEDIALSEFPVAVAIGPARVVRLQWTVWQRFWEIAPPNEQHRRLAHPQGLNRNNDSRDPEWIGDEGATL